MFDVEQIAGMKKLTVDRNLQRLKRSALHYLGQRSSSTSNLRRVITRRAQKKFEAEEAGRISELVEAVIGFCVENGFVNDVSYAETKAVSATRSGVSRRKLTMKLASKGVSKDIIGEAVEVVDDEAAAIAYARRRRLGAWKPDQTKRVFEKDVAALARAGFSIQIAMKTARMTSEDIEELGV